MERMDTRVFGRPSESGQSRLSHGGNPDDCDLGGADTARVVAPVGVGTGCLPFPGGLDFSIRRTCLRAEAARIL